MILPTVGDGLDWCRNQQFTTYDQDNDLNGDYNCAERWTGAWWYKACHRSNLNGLYLHNEDLPHAAGKGVTWKPWRGGSFSMKKSEMKLRPKP